jgi:galactoside O-acetyltransferase
MDIKQFKSVGKNVTIYDMAKIIFPERISLGDEVVIDDFCFLYAQGEGIEIGNFSHITVGSIVHSGGLLKIGNFSALACRCIALAASDNYHGEGFHGLAILNKYRKIEFNPTTLGNHVHIGAGTIILPGVTIGDGCSVGAGSLVTKDLPEWTICYGSPCEPKRDKPREKQLEMEKRFLEEYYGTGSV